MRLVPGMKKRPKQPKRQKDLKSDGVDVPSTAAPVGISGVYIGHAQAGHLEELRRLRAELGKLLQQQEKIEAERKKCHDRNWLDKFAATMHRRNKNFESALREFTQTREEQKLKTEARVQAVRQRLEFLDPTFVGQPIETLAAIPPELSPSYAAKIPKVGPNAKFDVTRRDEIIYKYRELSAVKICSKLDLELMKRDGPPTGFPENWQEKYGVSTFSAAYKNEDCRPLVQTLISKAKTGV